MRVAYVAGTALLAAGPLGPATTSAALKCRTPQAFPGLEVGTAVVVVDGAVSSKGLSAVSDPGLVYSLETLCWNPISGEFGATEGVGVINVISAGQAKAVRRPLEELVTAQSGFRASSGQFATRLALLDLGEEARGLTFTGEAVKWMAQTASSDSPTICRVQVGSAQGSQLREGSVTDIECYPNRTVIARVLAAAYGEATRRRS